MNYVLLILIPTLFYYVDKLTNSRSYIFEKLGIIFLIILSSIRVNVGADYNTYQSAFYRIKLGIDTDKFGYGFFLLNKIAIGIGGNFHTLLFIVGTINGILIYFILKDNVSRNYRWLAMFIFLGYFDLYVYMLSAIRQSLAVYICMFSIRYIYTDKWFKYLVCVLIAALFHWTAIIILPFYFIYKYLLGVSARKSLIFTLLLIPVYFGLMKFSALFASLSPRLNYYLVLDNSTATSSVVIVFMALIGLIIWNWYIHEYNLNYYITIGEIDFEHEHTEVVSIPEIALLIFLVSKIMQNLYYLGALPRMQVYFYCFLPVASVTAIKRINSRWRFLLAIIILLAVLIEFYYKVKLNGQYYQYFKTLLD